MNAIELLSVQYNFSVEDAVNILTMNNKKSRSKAKVVEPKREVEDLFAQLVNDAEDTFDVAVKEALDKNPINSTCTTRKVPNIIQINCELFLIHSTVC